jgi:hypothetical protein
MAQPDALQWLRLSFCDWPRFFKAKTGILWDERDFRSLL